MFFKKQEEIKLLRYLAVIGCSTLNLTSNTAVGLVEAARMIFQIHSVIVIVEMCTVYHIKK